MRPQVSARSASMLAALTVVAASLTGCGGQSCTDAAPDGSGTDAANIVYLNDVLLISSGSSSDTHFGDAVGKVRCELAGSDEPVEGGATFVKAGDALYRIANRPATEAVGAYVERQPYIFVTEQEGLERLSGRCTVPITQSCP